MENDVVVTVVESDGWFFDRFPTLSYFDILILVFSIAFLGLYLYSRRKTKKEENTTDTFTIMKSTPQLTTQSSLAGGFIEKMLKGGKNIVVFYGSQTGTAEDFANRLAKEAARYGLKGMAADPEECNMEELSNLSTIENSLAIFCMATYGEGDPTDNAQEFFNWLQNANDVDLSGVCYTVFGLGNKTYENYNEMGKYVDKRMCELGALRVHALGLGDDDGNIEENFLGWKEEMWSSVCKHFGVSTDQMDVNMRQYRLEVGNTIQPDKIYKGEVTRLGALERQRAPFDAKNPFLAKVMLKRELNKAGDRSCMHIELDISESRIKYDCGDHVAVLPTNDPEQVDQLAKLLNIDLDEVFSMIAIDEDNSKRHPFPCPTTYRTALMHYIDINNPPKTNVLGELAEYASDPADAEFLKSLASIDGKKKYQEWILDCRRNILAVLEDLPSLKVPIDHLLELLPRLQVRYYSISSSPKLYPNSIHITAVVVDYTTKAGRKMKGVATNYLKQKDPLAPEGTFVPIYVRRSQFRLPYKSKTSIIMVGPGTGVAPFRGFIQDRAVAKNSGKPMGETILYFGCRREKEDFLYEEELREAVKNEVISDLYLAFSRDQDRKIYVQNLMNMPKNKAQIWHIIDNGGHFYLCGDAKNMAKDVNNVLLDIFQNEGGMTNSQAQDYFKMMQNKGRHSSDVWS